MNSNSEYYIIAVSGGFDPPHPGHIRMFKNAKKIAELEAEKRAFNGGKLVVILNGDSWIIRKKGTPFFTALQRKEIIEECKSVDEVIIYDSLDYHVCGALEKLRPHGFANGGDRTEENTPEKILCEELGIEMYFGVGEGGKIESSSWLVAKYIKNGGKINEKIL